MPAPTSGKWRDREERTAALVDRLHAIVEELELLHPGRKFPLDGHLVGSLGEAAAETRFDITLMPPSTPGHDAISEDHRAVEIKGTYGTSGIAIRPTSHDHASALIVLRLPRKSDEPPEVVYNGPFEIAAAAAGPVGSNGQAHISLNRLRALNASVADGDRVARRPTSTVRGARRSTGPECGGDRQASADAKADGVRAAGASLFG